MSFDLSFYVCTHTQSCQVIFNLDDILNCVSNSADDTVNDMHNSIGGNLVAVDNPGTVHSHHLHIPYTWLLYQWKGFLAKLQQDCHDNTE